jgi:acetoacetyl-CoA synthetase
MYTSDGMLKPAGCPYFGPDKIYVVLERPMFSARIADAICVGQRRPQDEVQRVLLFIKMRAGHKLDPPFEEAICAAIESSLSKQHVPAYIFEVEEIPVSALG